MAMIGLASDDWEHCDCSSYHSKEIDLNIIKNYFGTNYLREELKKQGVNFLSRLIYDAEEAINEIKRDETANNPYHIWSGRQDKIERTVTQSGVWYTAIPTSSANAGSYGEVIEWMIAEGWPVLGDVEFLDEVDHPTAKDSEMNNKKYPPNSIKFRLKNSDVKKAFEADFKYLLGEININM